MCLLSCQLISKSQVVSVVDNISALRSTPLPIADGTVIKVLGYRVPGDGGGGIYIWSDTCATADDGGGIINIDTAHSTGRFIHEVENGIVNLKWWGIRPYEYVGFTGYDIADEFDSAQIFMTRNSSWKTLYIPCDTGGAIGFYYSTQLKLKYSITIQGDNGFVEPRTRIEFPKDATCIVIPFLGEDSVAMRNTINDIYIYQAFNAGDFGDSTAHGIDARSQVSLNRVYIEKVQGNGFNLEACHEALSPIYGNIDLSELLNCTAKNSNHGLYINGCDANKINVYKFNGSTIRRWGIYDNGSLGNAYLSPHLAFCGSGSGSNVVVRYPAGGQYYSAINPDNIININFRPDLFPAYWRECSEMGTGPTWNDSTRYWSGGPYLMSSPSGSHTIIDPYFEAFQPDPINSIRTLSLNGTRGSTIRGGADMVVGSEGLDLNTSLQITGPLNGVRINNPSAGLITNYPGVAVKSHQAFPTVYHESSTQPYVYERYKNTNNDLGYFVYQGTSFLFQPNAIISLEVTPTTIKLPNAAESFAGADKVMVLDPATKEVKFTSLVSPGPTFVYGEEFTGSTSTSITLAHAGITGTLRLFKNGVRLAAAEFTYTGGTGVTLTNSRLVTDIILADYNY